MTKNKESVVDTEALDSLVPAAAKGGERKKLSHKEKREAKRALKEKRKQAVSDAAAADAEVAQTESKEEAKAEQQRYRTIKQQLADRDKELSDRTEQQRERRARAKDVYAAIGFDLMFPSGLCEVEEGLYSETVEFDDVSYQSADDESQRTVFDAMASLLDRFSSDTMLQYLLTNTPLFAEEIGHRQFFDPEVAGENAALAEQYNKILNKKVLEGSSNIKRHRYISYATSAANPDRAVRALARSRNSVMGALNQVKSHGHLLDGKERLEVINSLLRPGKRLVFDYDCDLSLKSPLTAKDFICPTSLDFRPAGSDSTCFKAEDMWCQVLVMRENFASELTDRSISNILDLPIPMAVSWHLQPIDKAKSVAMVKKQAAWIQKEVIDNQRQALRNGYDYELLPPELSDTKAENEKTLDMLVHRNQRLYYFCGLVYTYGRTREELDDRVVQIISTAHADGIEIAPLALRQREGMNSVLPLAHNHVDVTRDFTTTEAAVLMPFTTQELDQDGGGYYGQNQLSGNLVLCNRRSLMSPHGFVCGMSGSGKSFAVKREIENTILSTKEDEIYIMDVTGEYSYQVLKNHGIEYNFGPDADTFMNPFDMADVADMSFQAGLAWKIDAILAMCSALKAEGDEGLAQEERSIITTCAEQIYHDAKKNGVDPTLGDLVEALRSITDETAAPHAQKLALVFDRFLTGPFSFLNHQSNVNFGDARVVSFNTRDVPSDMRVFTMLANLEAVRNRMYANHERGIATWLYVDEIQSLFGHPAIIRYLGRLWREGRKFGLVCTGMTQSASVMGNNDEAAAIMEQSGFALLLRQAPADRDFWEDAKGLSPLEVSFIDDTARPGQGLLVADAARVAITDDFPKGNDLYDMFNTSPEEWESRQEAMRALEKQKATKEAKKTTRKTKPRKTKQDSADKEA